MARYALMKHDLDPAVVTPGVRADGTPYPRPKRTAENTVSTFIEFGEGRPRPRWPDADMLDPALTRPKDCPAGLHGYGYWPVVNISDPLGDDEAYDPGSEVLTEDTAGQRWTSRFSIVAIPQEDIDAALAIVKTRAIKEVDREAGEFRLKYITDVPGQPQTYAFKYAEAVALVAAPGTGSASVHPFIHREAVETASGALTAQELLDAMDVVAASVKLTAEAWMPLGAIIEGQRKGAAAKINAATTEAEIEAAKNVSWGVGS